MLLVIVCCPTSALVIASSWAPAPEERVKQQRNSDEERGKSGFFNIICKESTSATIITILLRCTTLKKSRWRKNEFINTIYWYSDTIMMSLWVRIHIGSRITSSKGTIYHSERGSCFIQRNCATGFSSVVSPWKVVKLIYRS